MKALLSPLFSKSAYTPVQPHGVEGDDTSRKWPRLTKRAAVAVGALVCTGSLVSLSASHSSANAWVTPWNADSTSWPDWLGASSISDNQTVNHARCIIVQHGGMGLNGLGDYLILSHRCELAAQILGCECLRPIQDSVHHYRSSDIYAIAGIDIELPSARTCDLAQVLDVEALGRTNQCDPPLIGDPSQCDVFLYTPPEIVWAGNKLACVADRLRPRLKPLGKQPSVARQTCTTGYAALHYRYGDLKNAPVSNHKRVDTKFVQMAIERIVQERNFSSECIIVYAQSYPEEHAQLVNVTAPHVIDRTEDASQVMADMIGATVLFGGASGFMLPISIAFEGDQFLTPSWTQVMYRGLFRPEVKISLL